MSRKKNKTSKSTNQKPAKKKRSNMPSMKAFAVMAVLVTVSFAAVAAYKKSWDNLTDLSVIGSGVPVVVQVHDPSCPQCRRLKSNTESALSNVKGTLEYRIADLHSGKGRSIASKYHVGKVTLLTFNSAGELQDKLTGVRSVDALTLRFNELASAK